MKKPSKPSFCLILFFSLALFSCKDEETDIDHPTTTTPFQIILIENQGIKCMDSNGENIIRFESPGISDFSGINLSADNNNIAFSGQIRSNDLTCSPYEIFKANTKDFVFDKVTKTTEALIENDGDCNIRFFVPILLNDSDLLAIKYDLSSVENLASIVSLNTSNGEETDLTPDLPLDQTGVIQDIFNIQVSDDLSKVSFSLAINNGQGNGIIFQPVISNVDGSNVRFYDINDQFQTRTLSWLPNNQGLFIQKVDINDENNHYIEQIDLNGVPVSAESIGGRGFTNFHLQMVLPDNQTIIGSADIEAGGGRQLISLTIGEEGYSPITNMVDNRFMLAMDLSPDNEWLLFRSFIDGEGSNLWKIKLDGTEMQQLTISGQVSDAKWIEL